MRKHKQKKVADKPQRLAFYMPSLVGHGTEKVMLLLAEECAQRGYDVDLLVDQNSGEYAACVPAGVRVIELEARSRVWAYLALLRVAPGSALALFRPVLSGHKPFMRLWQLKHLVAYVRQQSPIAIISALHFPNILTIWACQIAKTQTRAVPSERNTLSKTLEEKVRQSGKQRRGAYRLEFIKRAYPRASAIVAVSNAVADDLSATAGIARDRITTIYNPVAIDDSKRRMVEPSGCDWLDQGESPVVLGVGRLVAHKGFATLIEAFAALCARRELRLVILGEGEQRPALAEQIEAAGLSDRARLPGWVANPFSYMHRAAVFVLPSQHEGLPGVLLQAMACGCPVVATDCPGGSREILTGVTDKLVPPGDAAGLAAAIEAQLHDPLNAQSLQRRAADFSVAGAASRYTRLIEDSRGPSRVA